MLVLKALAPSLMALGSIILAIRVKRILDALVLAVTEAAANHSQIVAHIAHNAPLSMTRETGVHVERSQRLGTGLLVLGFLLIAAGAILSAVVFYLAGI
jgi:hypothetical protein